MAYRYFPGKDQTWLEARLDEVLDEEASGQTITSTSGGDASVSMAVRGSVEVRKNKILHDLHILVPLIYTLEMIMPANRTAVSFSDYRNEH
jgi:hypothetical protein